MFEDEQYISAIREGGYDKNLVVGGPHPTTSYEEVLKDKNIDICVIGEGERTLTDIISAHMHTNQKKLDKTELTKIPGIAFSGS